MHNELYEAMEEAYQKEGAIPNIGAFLVAWGDLSDDDIVTALEMFYEKHEQEIGSPEIFEKLITYDILSLYQNSEIGGSK